GALNFNSLNTRDPERAEAFYGAVFGWRHAGGMWQMPGYGDHLEERDPDVRKRVRELGGPEGFEDVVAALQPLEGDGPAHWSVTFGVDDADETAALAQRLGGTVLAGPLDVPWVRMAVIADPAGATFVASQFVPPER